MSKLSDFRLDVRNRGSGNDVPDLLELLDLATRSLMTLGDEHPAWTVTGYRSIADGSLAAIDALAGQMTERRHG